ncbi:BZ3500_MvSof-1268-A1-R1_Chr11-2g03361 [Microbotryum saponariae]|uniref:BZ3500_MvSof-1268-A1-R1_Chr11-2g03361 protein n=1 Tax=Microbotryum saponariae TaxID=289078 RepID=A0A2X0N7H4_9BASI|nr:BZ3500_MvSof-1268-A1-R1_Chr11-2g03361 [Microbotryum saponariae]SDA03202.1 BZ3501_MvSof-1269-A2-R1_Chr11g02932 [Microbotryum saponariae]
MLDTTVPSKQDILVPETLLKKRKSTEKSREEKKNAALEARKVRQPTPILRTRHYEDGQSTLTSTPNWE